MRVVEILCDRCGNVIEDKPIKISMERVQREGAHIHWEFLREFNNLEFCEQCAKDIKHFICNPPAKTGRGDKGETAQNS